MMKTEQLRYLVELGRTNSFHRCAENLYLSQPAISLSIKNLEKELGVRLFERTSTGVFPTAIGKEVIQQAQEILYKINELQLLCSKHRYSHEQFSKKSFHFYCSSSINQIILPYFLSTFHQEFPESSIEFHDNQFSQMVQGISADPYSLGLCYQWDDCIFPENYPALHIVPLYAISFHLLVSKKALFRPKETIYLDQVYDNDPLVPLLDLKGSSEITRDLLNALENNKFGKVIFQAPATRLYSTYIEEGAGAGITFQFNRNRFISSVKLELVDAISIETKRPASLFFCCHKELPAHIYDIFMFHWQSNFSFS